MKDKLPEISKEKQKLLSRIKDLGGQIDAVQRSVTEGDECADIRMLLTAIHGGVNSLMAEILEDPYSFAHYAPNRRGESSDELTEDLIALVRAYLEIEHRASVHSRNQNWRTVIRACPDDVRSQARKIWFT